MTSHLVSLEPANKNEKNKYQYVNETLPKLIGEYSIKYLNDFVDYFNKNASIYDKLSTDPKVNEHELSLLVDDAVSSKNIFLYSDSDFTFVRPRYLRDVEEYDKLDDLFTGAFQNHRIGDYRRIKRAIENAEFTGVRGFDKLLSKITTDLHLDTAALATCSVPKDDDSNDVVDDGSEPKIEIKQRPHKSNTSAFVLIGGGITLAAFAYYMQRNHKRRIR